MICLSGHALAAPIVVQPASYTSSGISPTGSSSLDHTIDGAGLTDPSIVENGDDVPGSLPSEHGSSWDDNRGARWSGESGEITYNLGGAYALQDVLFWNYTENAQTDRGIKSVTASFSTDGVLFTGDTTLNFAEGVFSPTPGETVNLQAEGVAPSVLSSYVTHVKFTDFVNHSNPAGSDSFKGYAEIRFTGTPQPKGTVISIN